jgi:hypothetical protein
MRCRPPRAPRCASPSLAPIAGPRAHLPATPSNRRVCLIFERTRRRRCSCRVEYRARCGVWQAALWQRPRARWYGRRRCGRTGALPHPNVQARRRRSMAGRRSSRRAALSSSGDAGAWRRMCARVSVRARKTRKMAHDCACVRVRACECVSCVRSHVREGSRFDQCRRPPSIRHDQAGSMGVCVCMSTIGAWAVWAALAAGNTCTPAANI